MKFFAGIFVTAGLLLSGAFTAGATDFRVNGEFVFGTGVVNSGFLRSASDQKGTRPLATGGSNFSVMQRLRLQVEAVASPSLSGLICLEVGDTVWGSSNTFGLGGAVGTDAVNVKVRHAYVDWMSFDSDLRLRIGLQTVPMPHAAGGSSVMNNEMAAITANYRINEMVGISAGFMRVLDENYTDRTNPYADRDGHKDNLDLVSLSVPLTGEGWRVTPWMLGGKLGKNVLRGDTTGLNYKNTLPYLNIPPYAYLAAATNGTLGKEYTDRDYGALFFTGLPVVINVFDPLRIEADLNYGYSQGIGRYEVTDQRDGSRNLASARRAGWLVKGLVEYKTDWVTPGLLGWYASGDDGNVHNGSERMPAISPCGNFTSFVGDDPTGFGMLMHGGHTSYDLQLNYAGTWGIGAQLKDISFIEDLTHTLRVVRWGGTNSPAILKYLSASDSGISRMAYLTTKDSMIEFNLDSVYQISPNLSAHIQFGYIINQVDTDAWRAGKHTSLKTENAYKASAIMYYKF